MISEAEQNEDILAWNWRGREMTREERTAWRLMGDVMKVDPDDFNQPGRWGFDWYPCPHCGSRRMIAMLEVKIGKDLCTCCGKEFLVETE